MKAVTELENRKASLLKLARAVIRLKHSIKADEEIRRVLPELERRIDLALQTSTGLNLDVAEFLDGLESD